MSEQIELTQDPKPRSMFIILGAFAMATLIYGGIIVLGLLQTPGQPEASPSNPLVLGLFGLGAMSLLLGLVWGKVVGPKDPIEANLESRSFLARLQQNMIIKAASFETLAVYGLVGQLFGLSKVGGLVLCGISLLLILTLFPYLMGNLDYHEHREREAKEARG